MSRPSPHSAHTAYAVLDIEEYEWFERLKAIGGPVVASDANLIRQALRAFGAHLGAQMPVHIFALRSPQRRRPAHHATARVVKSRPAPKRRPKPIAPVRSQPRTHPWRKHYPSK